MDFRALGRARQLKQGKKNLLAGNLWDNLGTPINLLGWLKIAFLYLQEIPLQLRIQYCPLEIPGNPGETQVIRLGTFGNRFSRIFEEIRFQSLPVGTIGIVEKFDGRAARIFMLALQSNANYS